ncbi:MAG: hypothetical protein SPJ34_02295 [Candidatus Ornithospirochaeta sp.]|nr:hypothetical protein [Candidatus Ornithospirochaeta sp.]
MANGEEDLKEKNRGREKPHERRYLGWEKRLGHEDSEMLLEKSSGWRASGRHRLDYDDD